MEMYASVVHLHVVPAQASYVAHHYASSEAQLCLDYESSKGVSMSPQVVVFSRHLTSPPSLEDRVTLSLSLALPSTTPLLTPSSQLP